VSGVSGVHAARAVAEGRREGPGYVGKHTVIFLLRLTFKWITAAVKGTLSKYKSVTPITARYCLTATMSRRI
jgi:hypothetical protein